MENQGNMGRCVKNPRQEMNHAEQGAYTNDTSQLTPENAFDIRQQSARGIA